MIFVFSLLFILLFWENNAMLKIKDSLKKKNLAFVESLKQDLRRNNDDYADIQRRSGAQSSNYSEQSLDKSHGKADKSNPTNDTSNTLHSSESNLTNSSQRKLDVEDERNKIIDKIRKRVNDALASKEFDEQNTSNNNIPQRRAALAIKSYVPNNTDTKSLSNLNLNKIKQKISNKVIRNQIKLYSKKTSDPPLPTISTFPTRTTKTLNTNHKPETRNQLQHEVKKKKIKRFKQFIEKNKGLLQDFVSSKAAIQTLTTPNSQNLNIRQHRGKDKKIPKNVGLRDVMRAAIARLKNKESLERLPRVELLDMAPARGGYIHNKRLRGRLCQRHVLVPEGPKYSSGGRPYVPPHDAVRGHEYNATVAPRVLLPRCCNCCRKSVLGCE